MSEQYSEDADSDYSYSMAVSFRLLREAAVTSEAREAVGDLRAAMQDAREAGRTARDEQDSSYVNPVI